MEVCSQIHDPVAFPRKEPRYPFIRRLGGPPNWFGSLEEEKNLLLLSGFETLTVQPAATQTTIYWLLKDCTMRSEILPYYEYDIKMVVGVMTEHIQVRVS